jgi:membrane-associated protease RseP (regulator of RpoE activity)
LSEITLGFPPEDARIAIHPIAVAGWFGLFVTALNLLPIGQLDGGHVVYALVGARHIWISRLCFLGILFMGLMRWWDGWIVWGILLLFLGMHHPPALDSQTPLDLKRKVAGFFILIVFLVTFVPVPISTSDPVSNTPVAPHTMPIEPEPRPDGRSI